jgi:ABC-type polysaccharide/polyol phosphate export permease
MNKNFVITYLIITVVILIGIIMMTIFELFSENWLVSLAIILIAIGIGIGLTYFKIKK